MKKLSILLMLCASLVMSCTDKTLNEQSTDFNQDACTFRTMEEAKQIAINAVSLISDMNTRSSINRSISACHYIAYPVTKSGNAVDTLLYIFDYSDNMGFAVVSANENTEPLLAIIEKGSYELALKDDNVGFKMFMDMAEDYANPALVNPGLPDVPIDNQMKVQKEVIDTTDVDTINPKVTVQWGQTGIEGKYAPNNVAGCSNIAMAQIMSSFAYPSSILIDYSDSAVFNQLLDWSQINRHKDRYNHTECMASESAHEAISQLIRQLGYINMSTYRDSGTTGTSTVNVRDSFMQLGYTVSNIVDYSSEGIQQALNDDKVIFMEGFRYNDGGEISGHAWIVDGSVCYTINHATYWRYQNQFIWHLLSEYDVLKSYLHINWGWDGNCNGYFSESVFNTQEGNYDNPNTPYSNNVTRNYNVDLGYFAVSR